MLTPIASYLLMGLACALQQRTQLLVIHGFKKAVTSWRDFFIKHVLVRRKKHERMQSRAVLGGGGGSHHSPLHTTPLYTPLPSTHHSSLHTTPLYTPFPSTHHSPLHITPLYTPLLSIHHSPLPSAPPPPYQNPKPEPKSYILTSHLWSLLG